MDFKKSFGVVMLKDFQTVEEHPIIKKLAGFLLSHGDTKPELNQVCTLNGWQRRITAAFDQALGGELIYDRLETLSAATRATEERERAN
jgi:hypothetical protein